jgi:hypothetical protein
MSKTTSNKCKVNSLQKTPQLPKFYFFFKQEGLVIAKDQVGKIVNETIPYKMIKCINVIGKSSFYFKSNKAGYMLLFKNFEIKNAQVWFENLILLMDKEMEAKEEIKMIDITDNFSVLSLTSERCDFQFNLKAAMEKVAELRRTADGRNTRSSLVTPLENQETV